MTQGVRRSLLLYLLLPPVIGGGLAVVGPYGTFADLALAQRLAYWIGIVWLNTFQVAGFSYLFGHMAPTWPRWLVLAGAGLAASIPATAEVFILESYFRPELHKPETTGFLLIYLMVAVITVPLAILMGRTAPGWTLAEEGGEERPSPAPAEAPVPVPTTSGLLERLPPRLGRDVLCLQAEDHYVRVHTPLGSDLILARLSDAERDLHLLHQGEGLRVHRSWWVARAAVQGVDRQGAKTSLTLVNGLSVPVGRTYLDRLREAGWL